MDGAPDAATGKTTYINMRTCPALDNARSCREECASCLGAGVVMSRPGVPE